MKDMNLVQERNSLFLQKVSSKLQIKKEDVYDGYLIESSEKEARRIIDSTKGKNKLVALIGGDGNFNRRAIETLRINYLVSPEKKSSKDSLKQRDSGLNHVIVREAKKRGVSIVIDFNEIRSLKGKELASRLAKIIQNIKLCRKARCGIKIASLAEEKKLIADKKSRISLGLSLGMSSEQARDSVEFINNYKN